MAQTETERDLANIGEYADRRVAVSRLAGRVEGVQEAIDVLRDRVGMQDACQVLEMLRSDLRTRRDKAITAAHERLYEDLKRVCEEPTPPTAGA